MNPVVQDMFCFGLCHTNTLVYAEDVKNQLEDSFGHTYCTANEKNKYKTSVKSVTNLYITRP